MTFDINTADGTFTVKVDGKNESTITFTNTFTYKTVSPGGGGSTTTDTTKNDGKKVESGKTFDAGIAMYVGLSVLSVTGGALVIGFARGVYWVMNSGKTCHCAPVLTLARQSVFLLYDRPSAGNIFQRLHTAKAVKTTVWRGLTSPRRVSII